MSKVVLRALDLIGNHLRTHKSGGGADAPLDLAKQVVQQRMDNPAPAAPPAAEAAPKNTTQGSVFSPKPRVVAPSGLYSHAAEVAGQLQQNKGSAEQMIGMMKNAGVKPAELEHAGMITEEGDVHPDWAGRTVTRDELHKHLTDSMPQVEERVLGSKSKYPYHTADEWSDAISRAQHNRNFDEAERLTLAWEEAEGYGSEYAPKYKKWSLPGGENYRELLLKSPKQEHPLNIAEKKVDEINQKLIEMERNGVSEDSAEWKAANAELMKADIDEQTVRSKVSSGEIPHQLEHFQSSHWDDPDVLAHVRMSDRTGPNGEKLLHVEELQSDWGQKGREKGFKGKHAELPADRKIIESVNARGEPIFHIEGPNDMTETARHYSRENAINSWLNDRGGVPEAPYVTSTQGWTDLALKRVMKEAAEGGYHGIVFTPGAEQAKRYDLSNNIGRINYEPIEDGGHEIEAFDHSGNRVFEHDYMKDHELRSHFGNEIADKILKDTGTPMEDRPLRDWRSLSGLDLKGSGEGMKSYYDKMVPSYLQKLAKQHDKDAKLGTLRTNSLPDMLHLPVTDKMRESVLKGQKAFADGGEVEPFKRGGTAKAHPASIIPGVHIVGHNPIFHGDE